MKVTIIVDRMSVKTIEKEDNSKMTSVRLSGLDINGKRHYANYKYGKAMQLERDINGFLPDGSDITDVSMILVVEGKESEKKAVNPTTQKPYTYKIIEAQDYLLHTGPMNSLIRVKFDAAKVRRKMDKLFSEGKYSGAYELIEKFLEENSLIEGDDFYKNTQLDVVETSNIITPKMPHGQNEDVKPVSEDDSIPEDVKPVSEDDSIPEDVKPVSEDDSIPEDVKPVSEDDSIPEDVKPSISEDITPKEIVKPVSASVTKPKKIRFGQSDDSIDSNEPVSEPPMPEDVKPSISEDITPKEIVKPVSASVTKPKKIRFGQSDDSIDSNEPVSEPPMPEDVKPPISVNDTPKEIVKPTPVNMIPSKKETVEIVPASPEGFADKKLSNPFSLAEKRMQGFNRFFPK